MSKTFAEWFGEDLTGQTYKGNIRCSSQELTSLKGAPKIVDGLFDCSNNKLTSLEGAPQEVSWSFICSNNKLTSLKGAPQKVGYTFDCSNNKLTSLEGVPQEVKEGFECQNNQLTSLEGSPEKVKYFDCQYNKLTSLEGAPQIVKGSFNCEYNNLTSLEGAPQEVGSSFALTPDYFSCSHNNLTSLKGAPQIVIGNFWCEGNQLTSLDGIGEVTGKIHSDIRKKSRSKSNKSNDEFDDNDNGYLTNDQLKVGKTYALVLDKGYDWTLSEVDDFDLTEEEIQRLEDAGWLNEYREVVIPDEEPFVVKAKGTYGNSLYFPSVDITFDGLVGGDDDLYYKVESRKDESRLSATESKLLRDVKRLLNEDINNDKMSREQYDKMSPRECVRFLLKKSKAIRQPVSKEHMDKINKMLGFTFDELSGGEIMTHDLKDYLLKNNLKVKDIIPYIDEDARLAMNYGFRGRNRPAGDEALLDIFLGWYYNDPTASSDEKQIMSGLLEEDYVE